MRKISKLSSLTLATLLAISTLMVLAPISVKASPTTVEVINPLDGTHDFNFTSDTTNVGYEIVIDVTVVGVTDLQLWSVHLTWDESLLDFVSISLPDDHVFAPIDSAKGVPPPMGRSMQQPSPLIGSGSVEWGCTYVNDPFWTFNGTGRLCQVKLRIEKAVSQAGPTEVSCELGLGTIVTETYILNSLGSDITVNQGDLITGNYRYSWVAPSYYPTLYIKPAISKPAKIGDIVPLQIWVKDVHQGWEIIGFQFSLMWDTKFIEPASPYYMNGTFLGGFQYFPGGVLYFADINEHSRPMPLTPVPDDYNFSMFGAILMPDSLTEPISVADETVGTGNGFSTLFYLDYPPVDVDSETIVANGTHVFVRDTDYTMDYTTGTITFVTAPAINANITATYDGMMPVPYHSPFPHTSPGDGLLMTVYFKAIYETISPIEEWTWIEFIQFKVDEDTYALNQLLMVLPVDTVDCHYRAPQKILGLGMDLYTQYDYPYGGQGPDMPSDMFGPQQLVDLFVNVTYNDYPVQQKLVGFEIRHGDLVFWREDTTDENGVAHVSFRLPWPCVDPETEIFGKWYVWATVEVAEEVASDTLGFWVEWPVWVLSIEPKGTEPIQFVQRKTGGDTLLFTMVFLTHSMQKIPVTLTTTVYDELGFFIGSDSLTVDVGWDEYNYYNYSICEEPPFIVYWWDISIPMPTNAVIGKGIVFGNAFNMFPWLGGTPYCPEVTNTIDFYIVKP